MNKTLYEQMAELDIQIEAQEVAVQEEDPADVLIDEDAEDDAVIDDAADTEGDADVEVIAEPEQIQPETKKAKNDEDADSTKAWRMRQENKNLKAQLELANLEREKLKSLASSKAEPDKEYNPEVWAEWKADQILASRTQADLSGNIEKRSAEHRQNEQYDNAVNGFIAFENRFKDTVADYEQATGAYQTQLSNALRTLYPTATPAQIEQQTTMKILEAANEFAQQGMNPAKELYNLGKMVYAPPVPDKIPVKPDLKKIEQNKKRSVSLGASGGGDSQSHVGAKSLATMTLEDFQRLTPDDHKRMNAELGIMGR